MRPSSQNVMAPTSKANEQAFTSGAGEQPSRPGMAYLFGKTIESSENVVVGGASQKAIAVNHRVSVATSGVAR